MFYLKKIKRLLTYEPDGELTYDDKYKATIDAVNLEHVTLKLMCRAWANVSRLYTVDDVKRAMTDLTFRNGL